MLYKQVLLVALAISAAHAQMNMVDMNAASMDLTNIASGTSVNPDSWPMPMIMTHFRSWNTMFMGEAFLVDTQQSGPRGGDKLYSPNWFMVSAEHRAGADGAFQMDLMLSLDAATITDRRYPLLFQTGETAFGQAIVDGQHPHNLIMALGFHYIRELGTKTRLEVYFAPVGDPALGPVAYPHRASAAELPEAPISHHWQDSTHISDDVVTIGLAYRKIKLEVSGFHGAEPGENRWIVQQGAIDSWSSRLWFFPSRNWAAQVSVGRLTHPEALQPGDQVRSTASIEYTKPMAGGSWASSLIWGRNHDTATGRDLNSYLLESVLPIRRKNFVTGRVELVDKDELFEGQPELEQNLDVLYGSTFRIGAYTIGYTRDIDLFRHVETGVGANFTAYSLPDAIKPYYGERPVGGNIFIRFRLRPVEK
ncbi:MAG TPA: hypothetical protein VK686_05700 [Bryobacteraceae bacterium]|nr:hypothetical protein [Bryobacteraceae bacterium]